MCLLLLQNVLYEVLAVTGKRVNEDRVIEYQVSKQAAAEAASSSLLESEEKVLIRCAFLLVFPLADPVGRLSQAHMVS